MNVILLNVTNFDTMVILFFSNREMASLVKTKIKFWGVS